MDNPLARVHLDPTGKVGHEIGERAAGVDRNAKGHSNLRLPAIRSNVSA